MDLEKLKLILDQAVSKALGEKPSLLSISTGVHEQALCHRIALYLEEKFPGYSVDCEYNKHQDRLKKDSKGKIFRPDIVVHKRLQNGGNLLVVELKRRNAPNLRDIEKLKMATHPGKGFHYNLGVFISFYKGSPKYRFFVNGESQLL